MNMNNIEEKLKNCHPLGDRSGQSFPIQLRYREAFFEEDDGFAAYC